MLHRKSHSPALTGLRASNRLRLGVAATLALTSETRRCVLDDISATGAHLRVDGALALGSTVVLNFHELHLYATVMWRRTGECGLRFDHKLPIEDMQGMLWITQNRDLYERMCNDAHAQEWTQGIWE